MGVPMAMAIAGVATLAAQTPGAGAQANNQSQQNKTVTVVGCLQKGDQASAAPTGGAASTAAKAEFVLTNARMGGSASASGAAAAPGAAAQGQQQNPGATGTTGTAGRPNADADNRANAGAEMKYHLEGRADELAKHVGHQIEVTGSLSASASNRSGAQGATGTGGAAGRADEPRAGAASPQSSTGAQASAGQEERLQVSSIRMISANCEK
jgi:hypothetical protein